jgi:hypothetical protein
MRRPLFLIGAATAVVVCAMQAIASTATVGITATIVNQAGVQVVAPLTLPTVSATAISAGTTISSGGLTSVNGNVVSSGVTATPNGTVAVGGATATGGATGATSTINAPITGNATLTIHGQAGDTVSTAVPDSFQVVRSGGTDTLTVKTLTNAQSTVGDNGVILGGTVMSRDTLSVDIGGSIALASNGPVMPGPYEGLLVVVVQYN